MVLAATRAVADKYTSASSPPTRYGAVLLRLLHAGSMAGADTTLLTDLDARVAWRLD